MSLQRLQERPLLRLQSVTLSLALQRVGVVEQSVEDRRHEHVVSPLRHDLLGGDEHTCSLVVPRDQLEEEMRRSLLEGQVAELVDDEQLRLGEVGVLRVELAVRLPRGRARRARERACGRGSAGT